MSITTRQTNCQDLVAQLRPSLNVLTQKLSYLLDTKNTALLRGDFESTAAVLSNYEVNRPIIFVTPDASRYSATILDETGRIFGSKYPWDVITDSLTDQELSGEIITEQTRAYHALLASTSHILIPQKILSRSLPDPTAYRASAASATAGERSSLSELAQHLVQLGYTRYRGTLGPGGFQIRGETVHIQHPLWNHIATITFSGNIIERITIRNGNRTNNTARLAIPLVAFPAKMASWQEVAQDALVIRPAAINLRGARTIITDSATPELIVPESTQALAKQLTMCLVPTQRTEFEQPLTYEQAFEIIGTLGIGKPAVHVDHGIGIFEGLQRRRIEKIEKEYLMLRYAEGDSLSIPVEFAHKITPYVGDAHPIIHRLHGTAWNRARKAARADAIAFAKELLNIAGKRTDAARAPYYISSQVQSELDKTFPHELTDDQVRTWHEVCRDLAQDVPMDRLVVGDVGFGKTEIAYRAARHVIENGKQVAVLAPTTLLVQQHFDSFSQRLSAGQVRLPKTAGAVHLLSRFTSPRQQRDAKAAIISGSASIVVGTHALFSPKISWKNLGLVIIDEEQRFGVKQKEQLKKIRSNIDVLSLSATPIPRTLSMALSGLRSLSLISTAPAGRKAVETFVGKLTEKRLKEAIDLELNRGGQVYIVAPKIRQLAGIRHQVSALFPNIPMEVAHGKVGDDQLAHIIHRFDAGETKILVSSSIVEHGLDLPGANTMIVMYAPNFGLSELYQLRGRIGRRARQGYAYFFYSQGELTPVQRDRLTALTEASRLGSGWELARRDLEIRGAGNLLGAEQSGSVTAVGVQLYLDMVRQAASGEVSQRERADIALPFTALLPTSYIENTDDRTGWYVRLTRAQNTAELKKRVGNMIEKFGEAPREAKNLVLSLQLQQVATAAGIQKIHTEKISPPDEDPYDRIIITTTKAPEVIQKLQNLKNTNGDPANWRVRGSTLTWDVDEVTPELIKQLIGIL